ncbi:spermidine/putrescine ABC transporter substrate-binding protein [Maritimibacter sp. 55A14]|uniref:extracellular solute-binding protein n=1 Tax=Maritimibacter sp. 55A14 TaxID=2174844 RepID=UPI000D61E328|nr:extracellular solute-binding protein [Maritimibacter sp. 55A14]PWE31166.1 spermidine/putrescine ABC transporter substrate-binding protein [Maritimibacter sp. 55A14]
MRRSRWFLVVLALCATPAGAQQDAGPDPLTVVSWGGAYEAAQRAALFEPFTQATGTPLDIRSYDGSLEALRQRAKIEGWDVIDMLEDQAIAACDAGLLRPLEPAQIGGPAAMRDFMEGAFRGCSVAQNVFATVMAYDARAYPGVKPATVEDFFDLARFPGRRALPRSPDVVLEWALMAEGVPTAQVYDLLSTDRGLRLALRKLDTIRDEILWWEETAAPAEWLAEGRVAMAAGYNGRFFAAQQAGAPLSVIWDGRIIGVEVWAVAAASDAPEAALDFLRFASAPAPQAALAERIPYGPARRSALKRVGLHPEHGVPMRDHLPNAPQHGDRALVRDSDWYANTHALRTRRFETWLEGE